LIEYTAGVFQFEVLIRVFCVNQIRRQHVYYFAEIMMKHFVFSILMMAMLVAHQAIAIDSECLVQGSPWAVNGNRLFVRDTDNNLREWWRKKGGGWKISNVTNEDEKAKIWSDPSFFVWSDPSSFDNDKIEVVVARGHSGHLLKWQRLQYVEEPSLPDELLLPLPELLSPSDESPLSLDEPSQPDELLLPPSDEPPLSLDEPSQPDELLLPPSDEPPLSLDEPSQPDEPPPSDEPPPLPSSDELPPPPPPDELSLVEELPQLFEDDKKLPQWELSYLTATNDGEHAIAGAPSRISNGESRLLSYFDGETYRNFFTTPTPNDHLLMWLMPIPDAPIKSESISDDQRDWSVVDLTTSKGNKQTSAGNIVLDYWTKNIFTRDSNGHLFVGWQPDFPDKVDKIDLTEAVNGQTIIGDPTGYGDWFTDSTSYGFFQHVFARGSNDHLYEWRHIWHGKEDGTHPQAWREKMRSNWMQPFNLTSIEGVKGRTIDGDPAVYITIERSKENIRTGYLNVLARSSSGHLLKWSMAHSSLDKGIFKLKINLEGKADDWKFEDLTNAVENRQTIQGDPMMAMVTPYMTTGYASYAYPERIFVEGEDNHLLEWRREWNVEKKEGKEEESESWTSITPQSSWKVFDLTLCCDDSTYCSKEAVSSSSTNNKNGKKEDKKNFIH